MKQLQNLLLTSYRQQSFKVTTWDMTQTTITSIHSQIIDEHLATNTLVYNSENTQTNNWCAIY